MVTLTGTHIILRALEPEDLDFLFEIENNELFWEISNIQAPFSKYILKKYIENAHQDVYEAKQLRLVIEENSSNNAVGMIDLFDFNPQHKRAGVGILVHPKYQQKGIASEALGLLIAYSFHHLDIHQLYANITSDNKASIRLFEKLSFKKVGVKKDWLVHNQTFKDEILYQRIHD
ncbi:MAG: GNAT family N-acetyltransferase [Flavobacteriaceae bacterium]|nr:MAG: GNAT family N-acetyltransferase [Flavobacteriaceae bacterium]